MPLDELTMDDAAQGIALAGDEMQAEVDTLLPVISGMFSQTVMNSLVGAVNAAMTAAGMSGDYPEFEDDVSEFPDEFMRLIAMLADAAAVVGKDLVLEGIEDDRDVANLAGQIQALADDPGFAEAMTAPTEAPVEVELDLGDEDEALMMERM